MYDAYEQVAHALVLVELAHVLLEEKEVVVGPGEAGGQLCVLELDASEDLERAARREYLVAALAYLGQLHELLVAEVDERVVLMVAGVARIQALVVSIEHGEFDARAQRVRLLGHVLDEEREVVVAGRVAQAFRVQVEHPVGVLVGECGTHDERVDLVLARLQVLVESLHIPQN